MARELGIPSHVVTDQSHAWSIVYLHGRWETVDPTASIRKAYLGTDNKTFVANAKAYWANEKTGDDYKTDWKGFIVPANEVFSIGSWEKYDTVEKKLADANYLDTLDCYLHDATYFTRWPGTIYMH